MYKIENRKCQVWWNNDCWENEITDYLKSILDLDELSKFVAKAKENTDQHIISLSEYIDGGYSYNKYFWYISYLTMSVGYLLIEDNIIKDIIIFDIPDIKFFIFDRLKLTDVKKYIGYHIEISGIMVKELVM